MMDLLKRNILSVLEEDDTEERMKTINELLAQKQKELVRMAQAKKAYSALADEIDELREQKQELLVATVKAINMVPVSTQCLFALLKRKRQ